MNRQSTCGTYQLGSITFPGKCTDPVTPWRSVRPACGRFWVRFPTTPYQRWNIVLSRLALSIMTELGVFREIYTGHVKKQRVLSPFEIRVGYHTRIHIQPAVTLSSLLPARIILIVLKTPHNTIYWAGLSIMCGTWYWLRINRSIKESEWVRGEIPTVYNTYKIQHLCGSCCHQITRHLHRSITRNISGLGSAIRGLWLRSKSCNVDNSRVAITADSKSIYTANLWPNALEQLKMRANLLPNRRYPICCTQSPDCVFGLSDKRLT